uniref:PAP-associated domain-containing protein n=1 Tax=Panagrellus redivivus TaxID=6233 RepID=A0A7E4UNQ5_PANRE
MNIFTPVAKLELDKLVADGAHPDYYVKKASPKFYQLAEEVAEFRKKHPEDNERFEQEALKFVECIDQKSIDLKKVAFTFFEKHILDIRPDSMLFVCGSTVNGCGSDSADLDLCWVIPYMAKQEDGSKLLCYPTSRFAGFSPDDIFDMIRQKFESFDEVQDVSFVQARVPILKLRFYCGKADIDVDININNLVGIYNTLLLRFYSTIDDRFGQMCRILKAWGKKANVINSYGKMLNSYAVCLMIVHFFQCGANPPIFPNLNAMFPEIVDGNMPLPEVKMYLDGEIPFPVVQMNPKNDDTLTSLIFDFLVYWGKFDYFHHEASIRVGTVCPKKTYDPFFLEEVYDLTTVARNIKVASQDRLRQTCFSTLMYLKWTKFDFNEFTNGATAYHVGAPNYQKKAAPVEKKHFFSGICWNTSTARLEDDSSGADSGEEEFVGPIVPV